MAGLPEKKKRTRRFWKVKCRAHHDDGTPCNAWAVVGRYHCWQHGGADGSGGEGRPVESGRYARYIHAFTPEQRADVQRLLDDPNALCARDELTVAQYYLIQALEQHAKSPLSPEALEIITALIDRVTRVQEREAKRLSQEVRDNIILKNHAEASALATQGVVIHRAEIERAEVLAVVRSVLQTHPTEHDVAVSEIERRLTEVSAAWPAATAAEIQQAIAASCEVKPVVVL